MLIRFGNFELDQEQFELRRDGRALSVQPRVLETILFLAAHPQRLVTREQLISGPWSNLAVSDTAISQAIRQARVLLDDDPQSPSFIETVRGKGYRFQATEVSVASSPGLEHAAYSRSTVADPQPFFGRRHELARLGRAADAARAGRGNLVLVHGPLGVGKTRLVELFVSQERDAGAEVCWGGCREGQTAPPFWPWPEVLQRYAEARDDRVLRQLARGREPELAALAPELGTPLGVSSELTTEQNPQRGKLVLDAVAGFLRRAAHQTPLCIVLEDLHLADASALDLLEVCARSLADTRLFIIGTCRTGEGSERAVLRKALEKGLPHLLPLELRGLTWQETLGWLNSVATEPVPEHVAKALHFSTEGHPLLIENLVEALPADWTSGLTKLGSAKPLPERLRSALGRRLAQLDSVALEVLRAAAVFGEEFGLGLLASATGKPLGELLPAIERAQQLGVLKPVHQGRVRFSHALHRDLLYQELSATERLERHLATARAFAEQLAQHPELIIQAAHHFVEAAPGSDPGEVVAYACRAAEWAGSRHAYAVAESYYEKALEVHELDRAEPRRRAELLADLGHTQYLAGHADRAEQSFDRAFELSRERGFHDIFCRVLLSYFQMRRESVVVDRTFHERLVDALHVIDKKDAVYAQLQTARAMISTLTTAVEERVAWLEEALRLARSQSDPAVLLEVIRGPLRAFTYFTDGTTCLGLAEELAELGQKLRSTEAELQGMQWRAHSLLELGRGAEFQQQVNECAQRAAVLGSPHASYTTQLLKHGQAYLHGSLIDAERIARDAASTGRDLVGTVANSFLCAHLLSIGLELGKAERQRVLTDSLRLGEGILALAPNYRPVSVGMRCIRIHLGDESIGREALRDLKETSQLSPLDRSYLVIVAILADTVCLLNDKNNALTSLLERHRCAHVVGANGSMYMGPVCYWLGRLSLVAGNSKAARAYLKQAKSDSDAAGSVIHSAWSQYYLAEALPLADDHRLELRQDARLAAERYGLGRLLESLSRIN